MSTVCRINPSLNMCLRLRHEGIKFPSGSFSQRALGRCHSKRSGVVSLRGVGFMHEQGFQSGNTIKLAERRVYTDSFKPLYNEGMGLVERAAEYLDGDGRVAAKELSRIAATLYAAESMRLTTRLMQVASWLLLQRAANAGEMTRDQVAAEKTKVRLDTASAPQDTPGWVELPGDFRSIVEHSLRLQALVRRVDEDLDTDPMAPAVSTTVRRGNPVSDQINLLHTAFGRN